MATLFENCLLTSMEVASDGLEAVIEHVNYHIMVRQMEKIVRPSSMALAFEQESAVRGLGLLAADMRLDDEILREECRQIAPIPVTCYLPAPPIMSEQVEACNDF